MLRRLRLLVVAGVLGILATSPLVVREVTTRAWPGEESWALSALDPRFRGCLERTLGRLRGQGHVPVIRATWRDAARQRFYVGEGASQTMDSYHRKRLAADVAGASPLALVPVQAVFFHRLMAAAKAEGLTTGGTWRQRSPVWAFFGLGWDPAHVQPRAGTGCGL